MRILILITSLWFSFQSIDSDYLILIIDDCRNSKSIDRGKDFEQFYITLDNIEDASFILLGHGWIDPENRPSTMVKTYREIKHNSPIYSSDLKGLKDWIKLDNINKKIFILRPEDYCSKKRFILNNQFKIYEASLTLEYNE